MCNSEALPENFSQENKSTARSRRRHRRKELRSQEESTDQSSKSSKMVAPNKTQGKNENPKVPRGHKKGKKQNPSSNRKSPQKKKEANSTHRNSISSEASTTSTASLSDSSSSHSDRLWVPQHVQLWDLDFTSRFVALDCEMVGVGPDGMQSALGRVSLVNWDGDVIFDTFVNVRETITDLRTFVSGITKEDVDGSCPERSMDFEECVKNVQTLLQGKILVGHALKNDLRVLKLSHPWYDIRDTTKFDGFLKDSEDGTGKKLPRKLKDLSKEILGVQIQEVGKAHSSVEDATAAMNLYKSVSRKWEKAMLYKKQKTEEIMGLQQCVN